MGRKMTMFMLLAVAGVLAVAVILFAVSPGQPDPVLDSAGRPIQDSISEKVFIDINGATQGMFIQSANPSNPVLLFLHGGPGMPTFFSIPRIRRELSRISRWSGGSSEVQACPTAATLGRRP